MQHEQYQAHNQSHVNESGRYVKREKSKQPKNNQNCCNYPKHVFISLLLGARKALSSFSRAGRCLLARWRSGTDGRLGKEKTNVCSVLNTLAV
jgi:hypothetical protein